MYAIVKIGGKQYRVEKGDSILVDLLHDEEGAKVALEPLLLVDGSRAVLERSELEKVRVEATVAGHERGPKLHVLKFKPKKGYKRRTGHRSELTRLDIGEVRQLNRKPATRAAAKEGRKPAAGSDAAAKEGDEDGS
jgi:large subunit ribosomal protein L21